MNRLVAGWISYSAVCSVAGWVLSYFRILTPESYLCLHLGLVLFAVLMTRRPGAGRAQGRFWRKLRSRALRSRLTSERFFTCRRFFPFCFFSLAILSLLAGALYAPNNYDALSYRIPRVMYWLQEEGWHWIHTDNSRLNTRATGFEWLMAPQLAVLATDRLLFLINWISYLLMPGLLFSFLRLLGAASQTAWAWMWVFPMGHGYVLQSSGIANDAFATVFILAALVCSLQFYRSGRIQDLCFACFSAALFSGAKATNLPCLLPVLCLWCGAILRWRRKFLAFGGAAFAVLPVALLASFAPSAGLNFQNSGDWTGASLEPQRFVQSPWVGLAGNFLQVAAQNFSPPVLPEAAAWDRSLVARIPLSLRESLRGNFESSFKLCLGELPTELSGLGLGLSLCLVWAAGRAWFRPGRRFATRGAPLVVFFFGPLSLLWFLSKSALAGVSRILLPYFPVALSPLLAGTGQRPIQRFLLFRAGATFAYLSALGAVVLDPSKPLWPAETLLAAPKASPWQEKLRSRAYAVYRNYRQRAEVYRPVRPLLPEGTTRLGFFNGTDDPVASLWKPYGTLHVEEVTARESLECLQNRGLDVVLGGAKGLKERRGQSLETWRESMGGKFMATLILEPSVQRGKETWVLLAIPSRGTKEIGR